MIFIAYNGQNYVTSIVSAKSEALAQAYWQGAGVHVHTHKCLENPEDFTPLNEHVTGVIPILKTEEKSLSPFGSNSKQFIVVAR